MADFGLFAVNNNVVYRHDIGTVHYAVLVDVGIVGDSIIVDGASNVVVNSDNIGGVDRRC